MKFRLLPILIFCAAFTLSLKLAEAVFVTQSTGRTPVLALDDILSELDPKRRELVLEAANKWKKTRPKYAADTGRLKRFLQSRGFTFEAIGSAVDES